MYKCFPFNRLGHQSVFVVLWKREKLSWHLTFRVHVKNDATHIHLFTMYLKKAKLGSNHF